jgi:gamma-glutamyltranspeptidase / glutathione hydrolase
MKLAVIAGALSLALALSAAAPAPATSAHGMAATAHPLATAAAIEMLEAGGNAVDAAVAATFVISVTSQAQAGLGGGGFAVLHLEPTANGPGVIKALDFREVAPKAATREMYQKDGKIIDGASLDGALAVAVPGTVAGLHALHTAHGRLPWRRLLRPALAAARDGFVVGEDFVASFERRKEVLMRFAATRDAFMKKDGKGGHTPLVVGDRLKQPELARTLEAIAKDPRALQQGPVANAIAKAIASEGGIVTKEDLAAYAPRWRDPLCAPWQDLELCIMPPPSSGGVHVIQMLRLLEGTDLKALGWHHPDALHALIESMRIAFADRATHLGDPSFTPVPTDALTSRAYADARKKEIDPKRARKSSDVRAATAAQLELFRRESADTSHLSVVDRDKNAVSLTFTVNYTFGSGLVAKGTGILLNDEMDDFSAMPGVPNKYGLLGGEANAIAPGKVPLSSMTPLVARRGGKLVMTAGSPGGSMIITTVLQTLLHVAVYDMNCQEAVSAPRIHHQWMPDRTDIEPRGLDAMTEKELSARGHTLSTRPAWTKAMCIRVREDGLLEGGADPRSEGNASGAAR